MGNFARAVLTVEDLSLIVGNAVTGVNAVHGATERGEIGKSYLCRNWDEYTRQLGGLLSPTVSLFPQYCKRILDAGGIVRVSRSMHYTDASDISTATSLKATGSNVGAKAFVGKVIFVDVATKTVTLAGDYSKFLFATDAVSLELPNGGGSTADTVVSVNVVGGNTVVVLTSFTVGQVTVGSTVEWSITFVGNLALQAKEYGSFANNKLFFEIKTAASGLANKVDIFIGLEGYPNLNDELRDVSDTVTSTADLLVLTNGNRWVNFVSNSNQLVDFPKSYLTGGSYDTATINVMDVIGDITARTGIHSFDNDSDFVRLSVPEFTQNALDLALVDYCSQRQDCIAFLRVPTGLTVSGSIDYRNAAGVYTGGTALDTWEAVMTMSDIDITEEYGNTRLFITSLPDILGLATKKDNRDGAWGSFSGIQNETGAGVIRATYGVGDKNLGEPSRIIDAQLATAAGLIPVIDKQTRRFGKATMCWGNSTMQLQQNTLLKFAHVAELLNYVRRVVKPIIEENLFTPNDPISWKNVFRAVNLLLRGLVSNRAISEYEYIGDQDADVITDAVYNQQADIANGIYKFKIKLVPISKMEVVEATFTVVNNLIGVELTTA